MKSAISTLVCCVVLVGVVLAIVPAVEAADRDKLLSEPGVYGTFAAFSLDADWGKQDQVVRIAQLTVLKGVVEQHREKIAIDLYLLRGLSDHGTCCFVSTRPNCAIPNISPRSSAEPVSLASISRRPPSCMA